MGDATPTPGRVWEAYHSTDPVSHDFVGYLVTDADDPHRPLALVLTTFCGKPSDPRKLNNALRTARRLAAAPSKIGTTFAARDLRMYCRLDTPMPFPAELYGWRLGPVGGGGFDVFPFAPFCRFRFARMVAAFVQMEFTPEQMEKCPGVSIDITEGGDCGSYYSSSIQIPASQIPL